MSKTILMFLISSPLTRKMIAATAVGVIQYVTKKTDNKLDDIIADQIITPIKDAFNLK